jgi:formylglycine-generating enzyme required for sulfatase activity
MDRAIKGVARDVASRIRCVRVEVSVFLSYAPEDIAHRDVLVRHLEPLRRAGKVRLWHDGLARSGDDRGTVVRSELEAAAIVLLLVSADYLATEACAEEMRRALDRSRAGAARVVPVLLRPCSMGFEPIAKLSHLPTNGHPVTVWPDRDAAWTNVAEGIATLVGGETLTATESAPNRVDADRLRLLAKLEDARVRKRRLDAAGVATSEVDDEILALKRGLREGGQLRQGDILGGRYSLLRRLGRGGFATVWEAEDRESHARVAVKILHAEMAGDVTRRERFFRGARIMSELGHEAIVRILATEQQDGGYHYFVMELLAGGDLLAAVLKGEVPAERVVPLILRVGAALSAAHEHPKRFIHRDVKPANVLLDEDGSPKLSDFDLVGGKETTGGTRTGAMGSFVYAAPEMMSRPQDADPRADVFGLGMTALFCLHGKPLTEDAFYDPKSVLAETGRPAVSEVIAKAIERKAERRFADVRSFCEALLGADATERQPPPLRSPPPPDLPSPLPPSPRPPPGPSPSPVPSVRVERSSPSYVVHRVAEESARAVAPANANLSAASPAASGGLPRNEGLPEKAPATESSKTSRGPDLPANEEPTEEKPGSGASRAKILAMGGAAVLVFAAVIYGVARGGPSSGSSGGGDPATTSSASGQGAASTTTSMATESTAPTAVSSPPTPVSPGSGCPSTMVAIVPKGPVWIGSKEGVGDSDEHPRFSVTLKPYCMDKTEVTVAAYAKCADEKKCVAALTPSDSCNGNKPDKQTHPVNCVSWEEADEYCTSRGGRLPSEEEWEFAARGSDERVYPWGSAPKPANQLCWDGEGSDLGKGKRRSTCPVRSYPKGDTPLGLSDMAGNVREWTSSVYCTYPKPKNCSDPRRVVRGASWYSDNAWYVRAADRYGYAPNGLGSVIGFRCARNM